MIIGAPASRIRACLLVLGTALSAACGGSEPPTVPIPSPTPTPPQATPTPGPTPTPTATPAADKCANLQAGPVARLAVAPRTQVEDGETVPIRVRARPGFDEVWCLDKDKEHRLDFNLNQRNESGRECCWNGEPEWETLDPSGIAGGQSVRDQYGFVYRIRVFPQGTRGTVGLRANLDGVNSFPWQSGSGYEQGPIEMVTMSASEIQRDCKCVFLGNGQYEGAGCSK